ncbi:MAG TPA: hypothetical protein VGL59_22535 [Polyangia bacterium]|jgi:hypothetical protein
MPSNNPYAVGLSRLIVAAALLGSSTAFAEARAAKSKGTGADRAPAVSPRIRQQCVEAYDNASKFEHGGRLRDAKAMMLVCAQPTCSGVRHGFLRRECLFRHSRLETDIPSVIPLVKTAAGEPVLDVQVTMDGQVLASRADGLAMSIDPGMHEFVFKQGKVTLATQSLVVAQGQHNRRIVVTLPSETGGDDAPANASAGRDAELAAGKTKDKDDDSDGDNAPVASRKSKREGASDGATEDEAPAKHPAPPPGLHLSFGSVALATVAAAGGAGFGLLTYWGRKDNAQLSQCSPHCPQASVDHIAKLYREANIAGVVGGVALLGAIIVFATSGPSEPEEATTRRHTALRLGIAPDSAGAVATVAGRF